MSKFIFKLQSLLDLKLQIEGSLKNELGRATQKLEGEKKIAERIEFEMQECINQFYAKSSKGIRVEKLREYNAYLSNLKLKLEVQKENINYAQNNVDKYRGKLIVAVQERQMIEKLREKKHHEFLKEQLKKEQAINDEIVSFKYTNRMTGDGNA
jgi:flagellar protein FliJ